MPGVGCLSLNVQSHVPKIQAIAITTIYPLEFDSKTIMLKTANTLVTAHGDTKLIPTKKFSLCCLTLIVLECAIQALVGKRH